MRMRWVAPYVTLLSVMVLLLSSYPACAAQVVSDDIHQWARQAVADETSLDFRPTANTVAVLYFHNRTRQSELDFLQKGMAVMLTSDLAKLQDVQVVERTRLQALVQEMQLDASGLAAKETAPRVGRLLGARYLVGGTLNAGTTDTFSIDSDLLNVPQNGVVGSPSGSGTLEKLLHMEKELLFEIIRLLRLELTEAQKEALRKPITTDIKALMLLVQGIESSDNGAYEQAADSYRKALKLDPALEPARSAISELMALGLIGGSDALLRNLRKRVSVNQGPIPDQITKRRHSEPASVLGPGGSSTADVQVRWQ